MKGALVRCEEETQQKQEIRHTPVSRNANLGCVQLAEDEYAIKSTSLCRAATNKRGCVGSEWVSVDGMGEG